LKRNAARLAQLAPQRMQPVMRIPVAVGFGGIGIDDQRDPSRKVIDDRELFGQQQQDVRDVRKLRRASRRRIGELRFDMAHGVVAKVAGKATAKAWKTGPRCRAEAVEKLSDELERIAFVPFDNTAPVLDFDRTPSCANAYLRRQ